VTRRGHTPWRTCAGCRRTAPKQHLLRVVRAADGTIELDRGGTAPGRGGYVHAATACVEAAIRSGGLARVLRTGVARDVAGRLREQLEHTQERL
jgi:uncharacterized protein